MSSLIRNLAVPTVLLLSLVVAAVSRAEEYPDKWLAVSPEELALTDSSIEPGAGVEALFVKAWVTDGFDVHWQSMREYYVRMKIFTEAGAQRFAKVDIDYPRKDVTVDNIRARVIQPDGKVTEMDRRAVISETRARHGALGIMRKSFPLAGVRPGCVIEYRYRRAAMNAEAWAQAFDFQFSFPARLVAYYIRPLRAEGLFARYLTFHTSATTGPDRGDARLFNAIASNQRAYMDEADSPPEYQVRGWMLTYYTDQELQEPAAYWRDYGRKEWEWTDRWTQPDRSITELARSITTGITGDLPRVEALCNWIRLNFRQLQSSAPESLRAAGVRKNANARDALKQRAGDGQDAELALVALARGAGMDARYMRVPARTRMFFDQKMMSGDFLGSFDAGIRVDGRWRLFDVAARNLPWDMLLWSEEGQDALLCDRDSSRFIETEISAPERSQAFVTGTLTLDGEGTLEGDLVTTCTGHVNQQYRDLFEDVSGAQVDSVFVDALGWNKAGIELSHVQLERGTRKWDPLVIRSHVKLKEHATVSERRLILEPSAMRAHEPARFTAGNRRLPVYFEHAWSERDSIHIRLPAGWKVESVDSPTPLHSEGVADFRCSTQVSDDGADLLYLRSFAFGYDGSIYFRLNAYPAVKQFFDLVHQKDQATVTFLRGQKP